MDAEPLNLLVAAPLTDETALALEQSEFGPFRLTRALDAHAAFARAASGEGVDACLVDFALAPAAGASEELQIELVRAAAAVATLVVLRKVDAGALGEWFGRGVQDVLGARDVKAASLGQRVRWAIERKRHERASHVSYATDLETGLPHRQQLVEHISQLIALRERQPSPMALLVLRVEGLAPVRAQLGDAAAHVLRRKVAVRLRSGVRAGDVVATLDDEHFAVLLGAMLAAGDGARVAEKLRAALAEPFLVAGNETAIATAIGVAQYPQDGAQPEALLQRAQGLAASEPARGRDGYANFGSAGAAQAANDASADAPAPGAGAGEAANEATNEPTNEAPNESPPADPAA